MHIEIIDHGDRADRVLVRDVLNETKEQIRHLVSGIDGIQVGQKVFS
jgi:hypothetical protein